MQQIKKPRRLLITSSGGPDSGKTEFMLSAPDPGIIIVLDRGLDGAIRNPRPPAARRSNFAFKVITAPVFTQANKNEYLEYFTDWKKSLYSALDNKDCLTVGIDGDSDSWELQRLAEFGTLTRVPGAPRIAYTDVMAARKAIYNRCWDAAKIVIATNKLRDEFATVLDGNGNQVIENGQAKKSPTGKQVKAGFDDDGYLWQVGILHLTRDTKEGKHQWGLRITRCKHDTSLVGLELWNGDCNFPGLAQTIFPEVSLSEWGYK